MDHISFDSKSFNLAVDLAVMDIKRKYIQKILDLYVKLNPERDYTNVIYTIKFFDGTKEKIKTFTKDVWEFYDLSDEGPSTTICQDCENDIQAYIDRRFK